MEKENVKGMGTALLEIKKDFDVVFCTGGKTQKPFFISKSGVCESGELSLCEVKTIG